MRQNSVKLGNGGAQALHRRTAGTQIVIGPRTLSVITRSLDGGEREYIPDGLRNAADSDPRVFNASPLDFLPGVGGPNGTPAIGSQVTWHGAAYTVTKVVTEDLGAVPVSLRLLCYRTPATVPLPASKAEAAQLAMWPAPPT